MKHEDVVIGMKVVPSRKTAGFDWSLDRSLAWRRSKSQGQNFLYVTGTEEWGDGEYVFKLSDSMVNTGDYFNATDFEPYTSVVVTQTISEVVEVVAVDKKHISMFTIRDGEIGSSVTVWYLDIEGEECKMEIDISRLEVLLEVLGETRKQIEARKK